MPGIMRFDVVLIRLIFTAILVAAGYVLHPIPGHGLFSAGAAGLVAIAIIFFEMRIRRSSLKTLIGAAVGSILGIVGAYLIGSLISSQEAVAVPPSTKTFLTLSLTFFMAYVGLMVGAAKGDYLELSALGGACPQEIQRVWRRIKFAAEEIADNVTFEEICGEATNRTQMYYI